MKQGKYQCPLDQGIQMSQYHCKICRNPKKLFMYQNTYLVYIQKQLRTIKVTFNILPHLEMKMIIWKILLMSYITACHSKITTPIVFWHGMGGNNSRYLLSKSLLLIKPPNISFFFSKVLLAM